MLPHNAFKKQTIVLALSNSIINSFFSRKCESMNVDVVASVNDGESLFPTLKKTNPDFLLIDSELKNCNRLNFLYEWNSTDSNTKAIIYSQTAEKLYFKTFLDSNAYAFIQEDCDEQELSLCLRNIFDGKGMIFIKQSLMINAGRDEDDSLDLQNLTQREKDIWDLIGKELTEREIADKLSISLYTVKTHKNNISKKMGFKNKRRLTRAVNNYKV